MTNEDALQVKQKIRNDQSLDLGVHIVSKGCSHFKMALNYSVTELSLFGYKNIFDLLISSLFVTALFNISSSTFCILVESRLHA